MPYVTLRKAQFRTFLNSHFSSKIRGLTAGTYIAPHHAMCVARTFSEPLLPPGQDFHAPSAKDFHAIPAGLVAAELRVDPAFGLDAKQIKDRRLHFGPNAVLEIRPRTLWQILIDQFASIVIALLAFAAVISWVRGDTLEAIAILVVLLINALVGFTTEWQAGRALYALRRQTGTITRVRREGFETTINAEDLVPGDIVVLNAGDGVPADARLLEAQQLAVEESAMTGESALVEKDIAPVSLQTPLAERSSMTYLGTSIARGRALAVIVNTGTSTELGRIGRLVSVSTKERSPLELQLVQLGRRLVYLVIVVAVIVIAAGWLRGYQFWMMVEVGISLAVAAVPEALPAVTTLILALGVLRMARHRAIMRRLTAVETLGSTTVICADKTGTLTENRMTVREYYLSDGRAIEVDQCHAPVENDELFEHVLRIGVLCNEASFRSVEGSENHIVGDPTETALLVVADALVVDISRERTVNPKLTERPFHSSTKRMTTLHRRHDGQHFAALKGAPTVVLDACSTYMNAEGKSTPLDRGVLYRFNGANAAMASRALRVLALAVKHFDDGYVSDEDLETGYTFLGFVGMVDPPRPHVKESIREAQLAGIRTVMLTGDQINTGRAIAQELGLGQGNPVAIHARELVEADQIRLAELAQNSDVFARVSPEDKLRIVEALQASGEVVAVTGDGVNDAPALKRANIGIAMGQRGTEVAKEAADVVLSDDNFETILRAVESGRTIYANINKFVHLMFSKNLAEVFVIFTAIVSGWPLPLLPLQILWMNLVTDVFPALALAVEPTSPEIMKRPPRSSRASLLSMPFLRLIAWQAALLAIIALIAYAWALCRYGTGEHARTIALLVLIGVQIGHMFNCRSRTRSILSGMFSNPMVWLATLIVISLQLAAVYLGPLARVLGTVAPSMFDWVIVVSCVLIPVAIVETTKFIIRRRRSHLSYQ